MPRCLRRAGPAKDRRYTRRSGGCWCALGPQRQSKLIAEQLVLWASARVRFAILQNLPHAFATRFEEYLPGALTANPRQEADQELIAGERAVSHIVDRDGVGQLAGAIQLQPVGEQEQADFRPRQWRSRGGQPR